MTGATGFLGKGKHLLIFIIIYKMILIKSGSYSMIRIGVNQKINIMEFFCSLELAFDFFFLFANYEVFII